jgi:hypothetical protein
MLTAGACAKKPSEPLSPSEVRVVHRAELPSATDAAAWHDVPTHEAGLVLQDMVEPRLMRRSTEQLRVQAVADGRRIAFRLRWEDATKNDLPGAARFADACAVQLPAVTTPDVPAPQMGEPGKPVQVSYWSAFWQATVDGRPDTIQALYPNATVDHYPFEAAPLREGSPERAEAAARYSPARRLGNSMAGPRDTPVQDLIAEGPGTLRPAEESISSGSGRHGGHGWVVGFVRPLPEALGAGAGGRSQVAFAVWQGAGDEVGGRKMRTGWIPLTLEAAP